MKTKLIYFFMLLYSLILISQNSGLENGIGTLNKLQFGKPIKLVFSNKDNIIGSEYLNNEYQEATVITINNEIISLNAKLNTYSQEFEVLINDQVMALNYSSVKKIQYMGMIFKPIFIESNVLIYGEELCKGKICLIKNYKARLLKGKIVPGIQTIEPKDEIIIEEIYYANKKGEPSGEFIKLKFKKKNILEIINNDKKTLDHIKNKKLSYKNEEDIVKILNFYNGN